MSRSATIHRYIFLSLSLAWGAAAWGGCAAPIDQNTTTSASSSSSSSTSGVGGTGGSGGIDFDGGPGGGPVEAGACISTSAEARRVPLDIIFVIDRSASMGGPKWEGTKTGLTTFFNDPASTGISAGMVYFPPTNPDVCNPSTYATLDVPINVLPANAFELTNSLPFSPLGTSTPTYPGLKGSLMAATAFQESHPTHKVIVVLATDGDPYGCEPTAIDIIAAVAESARNYNGVRTYVIGVAGSTIANLNKIAEAGGTAKAYDITQDITAFSAKVAEIRSEALGCDIEIPESPGQQIDFDFVNLNYTPKGMGSPKIMPRAVDQADCGNEPGWYYDSNASPTKIILCPSLCSTVEADSSAKINALFGCKSILK